MKSIILTILLISFLNGLDFGKNVDVVGNWNIYRLNENSPAFFAGLLNVKWNIEFQTDKKVYINGLQDIKWKYDKNIVVIYQENKNFNKIISNLTKTKFKIIDEFKNGCYLIFEIDKNEYFKMCLNGKKEKKKLKIIIK